MDSASSGSPDPEHDPNSSFRLEITLSVGYQRKRAILGTKWEGPIITLMLALGGVVVVFLFLYGLYNLRLP